MSGLVRWLQGGATYSEDQERSFSAHQLQGNESRLKAILAMLGVGEVITLVGGILGSAQTHRVGREALHHNALLTVHGLTLVGILVLSAAFYFGVWVRERLMFVSSVGYLFQVALVATISQLHGGGITAYVVAMGAVALLAALSAREFLFAYAVAWSVFAVGVSWVQADPHVLGAVLRWGTLNTLAGLGLALFLIGARRRDYQQTYTIERQRLELEALNTTLEDRVAEQVRALTRRAQEVERLNTQLQAQVRDRSRALTQALRRLATGDAAADDLEGTLIGERFSVGPLLASGGMGSVYEGVDLTTEERVAIKVILSSTAAPLSMLERFLREAETAASVQHPAVVRMLHVDIHDDGTFYQVQEFVEGETLEQALERLGCFRVDAAIQLLAVLTDALSAAHAKGVVHRDIKPANLMLTRTPPGLKVVDFGISKLRDTAPRASGGQTKIPEQETFFPDMTRTGAMMGTPRYMSPEQRVDASQVTDRSDLYAVALVALLMLRGQLLQPGEKTPFSDLEGLNVPLSQMLDRCLDRDAATRPSAQELHEMARSFGGAHGARQLQELVSWDALHLHSVAEP